MPATIVNNLPLFGHARLADFRLAPGVDHLNHGSFGAVPRGVLDRVQEWQRRIEADPDTFFRNDLFGLLRGAAERVAALLGGCGQDWAFVENATTGLNAVIASLRLEPGDELLCLSQVYGAVGNALRYYAERAGARVVSVAVPVPLVDPAPLLAGIAAALGPKTRLALFDHIVSGSAAVLPVADMAALCRERGVPVAIDGAHAPGQIALDVPALAVDWYVGNLHKWAFAAKATAVLWCAPERQAALHPTVISHYFGDGFPAEFEWTGTRDPSSWLAAPAALDYLDALDAEAVRAHNAALAEAAGRLLIEAWGTEAAAAPDFCAAMVSVRLPRSAGADRDAAHRLIDRLRREHAIAVNVATLDHSLWVRVSAQIYNEIEDYRRLAALGPTLCR
ncbi:MAG TPA: aminotransferase class V-fold PLP-dependent enzyme [Stellaceae bacterium]|nr:aminotransferase class V-fold PLP-dependent enzyme [Stellaceae bacterium]